jgi:hypothetical protein
MFGEGNETQSHAFVKSGESCQSIHQWNIDVFSTSLIWQSRMKVSKQTYAILQRFTHICTENNQQQVLDRSMASIKWNAHTRRVLLGNETHTAIISRLIAKAKAFDSLYERGKLFEARNYKERICKTLKNGTKLSFNAFTKHVSLKFNFQSIK